MMYLSLSRSKALLLFQNDDWLNLKSNALMETWEAFAIM